MEVQVTPKVLEKYYDFGSKIPRRNLDRYRPSESAFEFSPLDPKLSPTDHIMVGETKLAMSKEVILKVIHKLNLTGRWKTATADDAAEKLWDMASAIRRGNTHFMRIAVTSIDKQEAAEIACELASGYLDWRQEFTQLHADMIFQTFQETCKGQQQAVERALTRLREVSQELNLKTPDPQAETPPDVSGLPEGDLAQYNKAKENYQMQLQLLNAMNKMFPDYLKERYLNRLPAVIMGGVTTESATFSRQRIQLWLAGCVASGLALASGLWLRRRDAV